MLTALLTDSVTPDLDRALHYALLWGLDAVALRTLGRGERVPHVNESRLRRRLDESDLPVVAVDPGLFEAPHGARSAWLNDLAAFGETAAFCRRVGCPLVLTGAVAGSAGDDWNPAEAGGALARVAAEAGKAGLTVAVRNDDTTACRTGEDLAAALAIARDACVSDEQRGTLGVMWNPAAAVRAGGDAQAGLDALAAAGVPVHCLLVEDESLAGGSAALGAGPTSWEAQVRALLSAGFSGPVVLEVRRRPVGQAGLRAASELLGLINSAKRRASA